MRIALVGLTETTITESKGGIENLLLGWFQELQKHHEVFLLDLGGVETSIGSVSINSQDLVGYINDNDIDIASFHNSPFLLSDKMNCASSLFVHNTNTSALTYPNFTLQETKDAISAFDGVAANSQFLAQRSRELYGCPLPDLVYPFAGPEFFATSLATQRDIDIFFPSRIMLKKGFKLFYELCLHLPASVKIAFPMFAPEKSCLKMVDELRQKPNIKVLPPLNRIEMAQVFQRSKISLLLPDWDEAFGLVAAEARAAGSLPVSTNDGGIREAGGTATIPKTITPHKLGNLVLQRLDSLPSIEEQTLWRDKTFGAFSLESSTRSLLEHFTRCLS